MTNEEFMKLDKDAQKQCLIKLIAMETQSVKDYEALCSHKKDGTKRARVELGRASNELLDATNKLGRAKINLRTCEDMLENINNEEESDNV